MMPEYHAAAWSSVCDANSFSLKLERDRRWEDRQLKTRLLTQNVTALSGPKTLFVADSNKLLWALDNDIQPRDFELLCVDLLGRAGYHHIVPIGGIRDHGRDAEYRSWKGTSDGPSVTVFQFSLQQKWEKKLREDADKIAAHCPNAVALVFVSSREVTGAKRDKL